MHWLQKEYKLKEEESQQLQTDLGKLRDENIQLQGHQQIYIDTLETIKSLIQKDSKFYLGFDGAVKKNLFDDWKSQTKFQPSNKVWGRDFDLYASIFLLWLRRGWTFKVLADYLQCDPTSLSKSFFKFLRMLKQSGWVNSLIYWPGVDEWESRQSLREKLVQEFPDNLFM